MRHYVVLLYGKLVRDETEHSDWSLSGPNFAIWTTKMESSRINFAKFLLWNIEQKNCFLFSRNNFPLCLADNFGSTVMKVAWKMQSIWLTLECAFISKVLKETLS